MFNSSTLKKLAITAVVTGAALAAPALASATTLPPPLQPLDTQAYGALTPGGSPSTAPLNRTFTGSLQLSTAGIVVQCRTSWNITFNVTGTTLVTGATFTACTSSVASCVPTLTAVGLGWGNRMVRDGLGVFRDRINITAPGAVRLTLPNTTCPTAGSFDFTGLLSPRIVGGNLPSAVFDSSAGTLTAPILGPGTFNGTLGGNLPLFPVV
jgi:hypothetical protein